MLDSQAALAHGDVAAGLELVSLVTGRAAVASRGRLPGR